MFGMRRLFLTPLWVECVVVGFSLSIAILPHFLCPTSL